MPAKKRKSLNHNFVRIYASRFEFVLILTIHCAAILAAFLAELPFLVKHLLIIGLFVFMAVACHRWRTKPNIKLKHQDGQWSVATPMGKQVIKSCYYWSRFCVVLSLENNSRWHKRYCTIFYDACSVDDFRHIKLVSRYGL